MDGGRRRGARRTGVIGRLGRDVAALVVGFAVATGVVAGARAQAPDCGRLRAAIRASESDSGPRDGGGFARAATQQRYEIERTQRYAAQLGCTKQAGLFDEDAPRECEDVQNRLVRMQDNLDHIQDRGIQDMRSGDQAARQAGLIARYNAVCAGNPANLSQSNDAGLMPRDGRNPSDLTTVPVNPDELSMVPLNGDILQDGAEPSRNAGSAICVRTCDGGYFPLSPHAATDQLDRLDQLCRASCPNTEARLYTIRGGDGLMSATAVDGSSYMALPTAFKFERSFSATCTCKPANQSWAEALAGAEKMLASADRRDVTVTAAMSDQMAKAGALPTPTGKGRKDKAGQAAAAAVPTPDKRVVVEGLRAAQAPTASNDSAGIGGTVQGEKVLGRSDGLRITVDGPDGTSKRIRLIVP